MKTLKYKNKNKNEVKHHGTFREFYKEIENLLNTGVIFAIDTRTNTYYEVLLDGSDKSINFMIIDLTGPCINKTIDLDIYESTYKDFINNHESFYEIIYFDDSEFVNMLLEKSKLNN